MKKKSPMCAELTGPNLVEKGKTGLSGRPASVVEFRTRADVNE